MLVQAPGEGLRWQAPAGCPDAAAVAGTIERRLGRGLAVGEARVEATVLRVGREFRLSLHLAVGARSEAREVVDESCAALAEVVALRVAAAVEGPAIVPAPPAGPAEAGRGGVEIGGERVGIEGGSMEIEGGSVGIGGESAGIEGKSAAGIGRESVEIGGDRVGMEGERVEIGRERVGIEGERVEIGRARVGMEGERVAIGGEGAGASRRSSRPGGVLRVQGGGEFGLLPGVTGAVGLAGGLLWRRVRVELQGVFLAPRTTTSEGVSLRAAMVAGSLQVCARRGRGAFEAPLCGGVELGAMRGVASGVASARAATSLVVAGTISQGLAWHASRRVSVWAGLQLVVAPRVPGFELRNEAASRRLFAPSPVSARLVAGVELRLGDPW